MTNDLDQVKMFFNQKAQIFKQKDPSKSIVSDMYKLCSAQLSIFQNNSKLRKSEPRALNSIMKQAEMLANLKYSSWSEDDKNKFVALMLIESRQLNKSIAPEIKNDIDSTYNKINSSQNLNKASNQTVYNFLYKISMGRYPNYLYLNHVVGGLKGDPMMSEIAYIYISGTANGKALLQYIFVKEGTIMMAFNMNTDLGRTR